jgi:hypothetical protein
MSATGRAPSNPRGEQQHHITTTGSRMGLQSPYKGSRAALVLPKRVPSGRTGGVLHDMLWRRRSRPPKKQLPHQHHKGKAKHRDFQACAAANACWIHHGRPPCSLRHSQVGQGFPDPAQIWPSVCSTSTWAKVGIAEPIASARIRALPPWRSGGPRSNRRIYRRASAATVSDGCASYVSMPCMCANDQRNPEPAWSLNKSTRRT